MISFDLDIINLVLDTHTSSMPISAIILTDALIVWFNAQTGSTTCVEVNNLLLSECGYT